MQFNHPFKDIKPGPFQGIDLSLNDPAAQSSCSGYMYFPGQYYQHDMGRYNPGINSCGGCIIPNGIGMNISSLPNNKLTHTSYSCGDLSLNSNVSNRQAFDEGTANFFNPAITVTCHSNNPIGQYSVYTQSNCTHPQNIASSFPSQHDQLEQAKSTNVSNFGLIPTGTVISTNNPNQSQHFQPSIETSKRFQLASDENKIPGSSTYNLEKEHVSALTIQVDSPSLNCDSTDLKHKRCTPKFTPENQKDTIYVEKRRKNNESARRSRKSRKDKEKSMAALVLQLEHENGHLRSAITATMAEVNRCRNELSIVSIM